MYVDNLASYFADITPYWEIGDFQYVKHDLDITIKINWDQEGTTNLPFNYVSIQNEGEDIFYYWIVDSKWVAQQTLALHLIMDTVNSLGQGATSPANPRNFTAETKINRQHMDRYERQYYWDPTLGGTLTRKIHRTPEGITFNQEKTSDEIIVSPKVDLDWYLIYRTVSADEESAIRTYLCASQAINLIKNAGTNGEFTADNVEDGKVYKFGTDYPVEIEIGATVGGEQRVWNIKTGGWYYKGRDSDNDPQAWKIGNITFHLDNGDLRCSLRPLEFKMVNPNKYPSIEFLPNVVDYIKVINGSKMYVDDVLTDVTNGQYVVDTWVNSIDSLDRQDPRLVKVLKLPYCPIDFRIREDGSFYPFNDWIWESETGFLIYNSNNLPLLEQGNFAEIDLSPEMSRVVGANDIREDSRKNVENESKMFHSEFHTVKAVYDSFSYPIDMDRFSYLSPTDKTVSIDFKPTSTINSKIGFRFNLENVGTYNYDQDFGQYLLATRNNEEVIMNNEYLNYIKNGINYDKKANSLAMENAARGAAIGVITTGASALATAIGFGLGPGVGTLAGVGFLSSTVSGAASSIDSVASVLALKESQENSMKQKLAQLQMQSASVAGTDDIDLMSWYSDNRLHLMRYDLPEHAQNPVYNMFDLLGYKIDKYEVPNVDSRIWYNFIQCEPVFKKQGVEKYKQMWLEDLRAKYKAGITVYHNRGGRYNFEQLYENWETWITDGTI